MLKLDTLAELQALHTGNTPESLHLEYKASDAVDKADSAKKIEMARDVSAFANAAGGQIVYAMAETKDHEPAGLDQGIDPKTYPTLWFEHVLQQHVTPTISGLKIKHVPLANGNVAVVIDVPATSGDPHQVSDGKYFRRHNFSKLPMEHYEVRDMFRRTTAPDLFVELSLPRKDNTASIEYEMDQDLSEPISLTFKIGNRSNQPALYAAVQIGLDPRIEMPVYGEFNPAIVSPNDTSKWFVYQMMSPPSLPIFKEVVIVLRQTHIRFHRRVSYIGGVHRFPISVGIRTSGQSTDETWYLHQEGQLLSLLR